MWGRGREEAEGKGKETGGKVRPFGGSETLIIIYYKLHTTAHYPEMLDNHAP